MAKTKDLTHGTPGRIIFAFCIPLIFGNLFQQMYTLVDLLVVGRTNGVNEMAAVSSSGWLLWTVLAVGMGLTQGFAIQASQSFGSGNEAELKHVVGQSLILSGIISLVLVALTEPLLYPILLLMNAPDETIRFTELYLRIVFAGTPLCVTYNLFSGLLRSLGNSKAPFVAMVVSSAVNITLDIVFVTVFRMGVAGVACATVISQGISCIVSGVPLFRMREMKLRRSDLRLEKPMVKRLLTLGIPMSLQNVGISVGGLIMQSQVNARGVIFMAGFNAASQMQSLVELAGASLGYALTAFAGQNIGAGRMDRVRQGVRSSVWISLLMACAVSSLLLCFGKNLLSLFIQDDPAIVAQVLETGYSFLRIMSFGLPVLYLLFVYRSTLQGLGDTFLPMISGAAELLMRISMVFLLPLVMGDSGVFWAEISAWTGGSVFNIISYYWRIRHMKAG